MGQIISEAKHGSFGLIKLFLLKTLKKNSVFVLKSCGSVIVTC